MDPHIPIPAPLPTKGTPGVIEFRHVSLAHRNHGLSAVSFQLVAGETYGWLGGPGSGKTLIVDLVMGFRRPDFGAVNVLGMDPASAPQRLRRTVAFVDGRGRLAGAMTPIQNLTFLAKLAATEETRDAIVNSLRLMGLPDRHLECPMEELSTAAHVSVFLALAWLRRIPLLVLDDPTAGFDSVATATLIDSLRQFHRVSTTVLLTTSDVLLAAKAADHVGILKGGTKVAERHKHQLLQESLTALYADYVGRDDTSWVQS